ncbi:MAG: HemK2/MTQ2 family protein methyltransferase [Thermoplasmata archaeon]
MERIESIEIEEWEEVYSPDEDTYLLLDLINIDKGEDVLEIGSGTGIISLHCASYGANVTAVDINEKAVLLTKINSEYNNIPLEDVRWSDMFLNIDGLWDVIIFNPPYLPNVKGYSKDPRWDGGIQGDETVIRFLESAYSYLRPGARVYFCSSDMAPLTRIYNTIEAGYFIIEQREKTFDFESIYVFALMAANYSNSTSI